MSDWPHSPIHRLTETGAYIVTAGTYGKFPIFRSADRLTLLTSRLLRLSKHYEWQLQAWAVFPNHYHFVAISSANPSTLRRLIQHFHSETAREVNATDQTPARKVWFEYWDTHLTFQRSYLARSSYVHQNPVRHGLVRVAQAYPWCSASWFERSSNRAFYRTVLGFTGNGVQVPDEFNVDSADVQDA